MQWLPEGHLAYFVLELVRELDVSAIEAAIQSKDGRGTRRYSPRMMTALQAYNAQAMVSEAQIVVAHAVTNQPTDPLHLVPMMDRVGVNCGGLPPVLTADNGYLSEVNVAHCERRGVDAYIAVRRKGEDGPSLGKLPMTSSQHV